MTQDSFTVYTNSDGLPTMIEYVDGIIDVREWLDDNGHVIMKDFFMQEDTPRHERKAARAEARRLADLEAGTIAICGFGYSVRL